MKKICKYILSLVALLAFGTMMEAQTAEGIVVNKTVTQTPDDNGVYWITLESFVTGAVTVKMDSKPADIVLVLDVSSSMTKNPYGSYSTRLAALRASVLDFIDIIDKNDLYEDWEEDSPTIRRKDQSGHETRLGNRISIIPFGGSLGTGNLAPVDLTSLENKSTLIEKTNGLTTTINHTNPYVGLEKAKDYLADAVTAEQNKERDESTKTVVLFTDGCPAERGETKFEAEYAYNAVRSAYDIKTSATYGEATVYTIGLFTNLGTNETQVKNYMNYASSNFPDATASAFDEDTNPQSVIYNTGSGGTYDGKYFQMAGDDDLTEIFKAIAHDSGGSGADLTEESLVDVDVVSNSFSLPSGELANDYDIEIYVAQCIGYDSNGKGNQFGDPIFVPNNGGANFADVEKTVVTWGDPLNVDRDHHDEYNESISIKVVGNEIETSGFNFGLNYCGRHSYYKSETEYKYYADGYKLIVKIPIVVNDDAVGGAGTQTNDPESGIYVKDETQPSGRRLITKFPQPDITIPVNIWIKKYGLNKGESAKFLVQRILVGQDVTVDANWIDYTSVLITGTGETETMEGGEVLVSPIAKLNGLSEKYHYRVIEADYGDHKSWAWSYNSPDGPIATYDIEKNPMVFTNVKKSTSVHHAESKAINVFGVGKSATTIDSREFFKHSSE